MSLTTFQHQEPKHRMEPENESAVEFEAICNDMQWSKWNDEECDENTDTINEIQRNCERDHFPSGNSTVLSEEDSGISSTSTLYLSAQIPDIQNCEFSTPVYHIDNSQNIHKNAVAWYVDSRNIEGKFNEGSGYDRNSTCSQFSKETGGLIRNKAGYYQGLHMQNTAPCRRKPASGGSFVVVFMCTQSNNW